MFHSLLLSQSEQSAGVFSTLLMLALIVAVIAGMWKVFEKANQPGWGVLVPIYNIILMLKIAGKPAWWIILLIIPVVSFVVAILVALAIGKNFGKSTGFGIGLALLPFVFYPLLGFSDAQYNPVAVPAGGGFDPMRAYDRMSGGTQQPG